MSSKKTKRINVPLPFRCSGSSLFWRIAVLITTVWMRTGKRYQAM